MLTLFLLAAGIASQQPQREQLDCLSKPQPLCYVIDFSLSVFKKWLFTWIQAHQGHGSIWSQEMGGNLDQSEAFSRTGGGLWKQTTLAGSLTLAADFVYLGELLILWAMVSSLEKWVNLLAMRMKLNNAYKILRAGPVATIVIITTTVSFHAREALSPPLSLPDPHHIPLLALSLSSSPKHALLVLVLL